jgi:hypothetical protein
MKLVIALGMINECFSLVKDRHTKIDMLHQAVYILGSKFKWLSYEGFYTMVLKKYRDYFTSSAEDPLHKSGGGALHRHTITYQKQEVTCRLVSVVEQVLALVK